MQTFQLQIIPASSEERAKIIAWLQYKSHPFAEGYWTSEQDAKEAAILVYQTEKNALEKIKQEMTKEFNCQDLAISTLQDSTWQGAWSEGDAFTTERFILSPAQSNQSTNLEVIALPHRQFFGTGAHATTLAILRALEALPQPQGAFLDVGCGNGVLTIAAGKLGYRDLTATDLDEAIVEEARQNLLANDIDATVLCQEHVPQGRFDVICANIPAAAAIPLLGPMRNVLNANGHILLAGFMDADFDLVHHTCVDLGFGLNDRRDVRGWLALDYTRTNP